VKPPSLRSPCHVSVEARVWLRAHRPIPADFQIEQQLVGVKLLAEAAEGWPLEVIRGRSSEISVEDEFSILFGDMQFVLVRIEEFDSVLRAFGERYAMPGVFVRAVGAGFGLARPARHFKLGPPRVERRIHQAEFDFLHRPTPARIACCIA
jgi:hypothetical protein